MYCRRIITLLSYNPLLLSLASQLHDVLPRQQFVTVIQAKADGKIVASKRIQAYRKDVRLHTDNVCRAVSRYLHLTKWFPSLLL